MAVRGHQAIWCRFRVRNTGATAFTSQYTIVYAEDN